MMGKRQNMGGQKLNTTANRTNNHACSLNPRAILESLINLTWTFLHTGRKPGYPERTLACTGRT